MLKIYVKITECCIHLYDEICSGRMLLKLFCLMIAGIHLSTQDLVTLAPSEVPPESTEPAPTPTEVHKL